MKTLATCDTQCRGDIQAWAVVSGKRIVLIRLSKKLAIDLCEDLNEGLGAGEYSVTPVTVTLEEKEKGE